MSIQHFQQEIQWRGPVFRQRKGMGRLTPSPLLPRTALPIDCEFEVFQFQDGGIYAYGVVSDDGTHTNPSRFLMISDDLGNSIPFGFVGQSEGFEIGLKHLLLTGTNMKGGVDQETQVFFRLCVGQVEEVNPSPPAGLFELRFYLTNLKLPHLPPTEVRVANGYSRQGSILELKVGEFPVWLEPLPDEDKRFERLEITNGIEATTIASVFCLLEEREAVEKHIAHLCQLLTFIQGTRVNWLAYDLLSMDDEPTRYGSWWHDAVTRRFGGADLLNRLVAREFKMRVGGQTYRSWVENLFPQFVAADEKWGLTSLTNAYLDAADGGDFLELRGLKICGCMEILRDRFLDMEDKTHIVDPMQWASALPTLQEKTLPILKELLPNEADEMLSRLTNHFRGMNYYPFRRAVSELCQQIDYATNGSKKQTKDAIGAFLSIRDGLVHRGCFAVPSKPQPDWTSKDISHTRWTQYQFIERFCGGLLAALIGWNQAQAIDECKAFMPVAPRVWEGN